jgi:hypothetical protein
LHSFEIDPEGAASNLRVELALDLDPGWVEDECGIPSEELSFAVVEEQPFVRRNTLRAKWRIADVPDQHAFDVSADEYGSSPFSVRLVIVLHQDRPTTSVGTATRRHSIVSERDFLVHAPVSRSLFLVENTSFDERGWDRKALWYCEFRDLEGAAEGGPEEVLTVHLNKDLTALQELWRPAARRNPVRRPAAAMIQKLVGTGILVEVVSTVLNHHYAGTSEDDGEPAIQAGSLLSRMRASLEVGLHLEFEEITRMAANQPGLLVRRIQDWTGCGSDFDRDVLAAIDSLAGGGR